MKLLDDAPEKLMTELLDEIGRSQSMLSRHTQVMTLLVSRFADVYISEMGGFGPDGESFRSLVAEIAMKLKIGQYRAQRLVEHSLLLNSDLPDVAFAVEIDAITFEQAEVILTFVGQADLPNRDKFVTTMLTHACGATWLIADGPAGPVIDEEGNRLGLSVPALKQKAKQLLAELNADDMSKRHQVAKESRYVEVEEDYDGMAWLKLYMSSVEAHGIYQGLHSAAKQILPILTVEPEKFGYTGRKRADAKDGLWSFQSDTDLPTLSQLRLDIAQDLLLAGYLDPAGYFEQLQQQNPAEKLFSAELKLMRSAGQEPYPPELNLQYIWEAFREGQKSRQQYSFVRINPVVSVTVPMLSLLDLDNTPAILDGQVPISVEDAKSLCGMVPSVTRILTHPETGVTVSVGREKYRVPNDMKALILSRDQHCRWPGCQIPAIRCEIDHTTAWHEGGETAISNLSLLCRGHHILKHYGENKKVPDGKLYRWRLRQGDNGALTFTSPANQVVTTVPDPLPATLFHTDPDIW